MGNAEQPVTLYTVGHSNHPMGTFLGLLRDNQIEVLIDTRSAPFSRYSPHFNRDDLKAALHGAGIKYGFYGRHLGGRPDDEEMYDEAGRVDYARLAQSFLFNDGIERLMRGIQTSRTALLCSEENPSICHRRLLVSRVLYEQGIDVLHIRGNGRIKSESGLRHQEQIQADQRRGLFEDEREEPEWKSIQSVLQSPKGNFPPRKPVVPCMTS